MAATAPAIQEAKKALKEMSEPLTEIYKDLSKKMSVLAKTDIMARYEIGERIDTVLQSPDKYGQNAARQLAAGLQVSESLLYGFRQLTHTWSRDEVAELLEKRNAVGGSITFGHLTALMTIKKSSARVKMLGKWERECLGVRDLAAAIQELMGRNPADKPAIRPKSPKAGLASASKVLSNLRSTHEFLGDSVFDNIDNEPTKYADKTMIKNLEGLDAAMQEASANLATDRRKLANALDLLYRAVRADEEANRAPATPARRKRSAAVPEEEATGTEPAAEVVAAEVVPARRKKKRIVGTGSKAAAAVAKVKHKRRQLQPS